MGLNFFNAIFKHSFCSRVPLLKSVSVFWEEEILSQWFTKLDFLYPVSLHIVDLPLFLCISELGGGRGRRTTSGYYLNSRFSRNSKAVDFIAKRGKIQEAMANCWYIFLPWETWKITLYCANAIITIINHKTSGVPLENHQHCQSHHQSTTKDSFTLKSVHPVWSYLQHHQITCAYPKYLGRTR